MFDARTSVGTTEIAGLAPGASDGDLVDVRCYTPRGYSWPGASNVPVSGGSFSLPSSALSDFAGSLCRLRAVPAGEEPSDTSPYTGPMVEIDEVSLQLENPYDSGNLKPNRFNVRAGQFAGRMEWSSGSCPLTSNLVDIPNFDETEEIFDCAHRFNGLNDEPTQSPIQVDGTNGWLTSNFIGSAYENEPNFPGLSISPTINSTNGNLQLEASEDLTTCTNDTAEWWVGGQECPPLLGTGVRLDRTVTQSHSGSKAIVRDRWVSTDGQPHTISLRYRERFQLTKDGSPDARYLFPGGETYDEPANGTLVPGPIAADGTIYVFDPSIADGSTEVGRAGIKLVSGADSAEFESDGYDAPKIILNYVDRAIPAGGALELTTEFYQAFSQARLEALAAGAPDDGDSTPPPTGEPPLKPTITGALGVSTAASRKKPSRVTVTTKRKVNCPAGGSACAATVALTTKVKVRSGRKTVTKTVKLGNFSFSIPAGGAKQLRFTLAAKHTKHFRANRSLKVSALITASAGSGDAVVVTDRYTAKRPTFKK